MTNSVQSKDGIPISVGDTVYTKIRGGRHEGEVEAIAHDQEEAEQVSEELGTSVKNPPKVVFSDQHGHRVSHNPGTLTHPEGSG
ncbi:uncharacterized protein C8Q71DRAFT_543442 [Rhodofomes roseus]|uniref:Hypervirulence associated protein TUDOR domain-containing protein n=1 Tax=Rhodofomes roseus TaxID=34475 RepID=A0ABQ8KMA8_9APHY|nr:uncharacterized protein C8Q71DRAFT_543442 [Rhodofomes roseus]KAH9838722.1 hypothetical protein C8Q71DRAFT_543442 [Rhodofomes roseus]